jgi:uncharacterized protein (TIGR03437 family)
MSRIAFSLFILAATASAQCYQFSGPGVTLQINVTTVNFQTGPTFLAGGHTATYAYSGSNSFTLWNVTQTSQSVFDGTANIQYLPPSGPGLSDDATTFQMVVPNADPAGKGSHLWDILLASNGDLIPSGLLPSPQALPPVSAWNLRGATNVAGVNYNYIEVQSGSARTKYLLTDVRACGSGGGSAGTGPVITRVTNNSSDIPAGFPNSGIAQGALFKIVGGSLADGGDATLHDSQASGGLPFTLNGSTVTVTVGTTTVNVPLYYATPGQIDGVLPANTPLGAGTVTVTHNGAVSNAYPIQVVAAAPGITTYNGSGVTQHATTGQLVTYTNSAEPTEVIIIWGSGFGATTDSDTSYATSPHQTSIPYNIYIGGIQASVAYAGRSVYPGVSVFGVTIPQNAPTGCYVPITAVANGNVVGNVVTIPIHVGKGTCSDPQLGFSGDQISSLSGRSSVNTGVVFVGQSTAPGAGTTNVAGAVFNQVTGANYAGGATVSIGGCILLQATSGSSTGTATGLSPGTIIVTGPSGTNVTLTAIQGATGTYFATIPAIPTTGGAYVFNATAGSQVGAFTTTVNFPNPILSWTNQSAAATIARGGGLTVAWTGGSPGSYVTISGSSTSGGATGTYTCIAPQSALSFTVPAYVLLGLPAGNGSTAVTNSTNLSTFTASGLDFGGAVGTASFSVASNYN